LHSKVSTKRTCVAESPHPSIFIVTQDEVAAVFDGEFVLTVRRDEGFVESQVFIVQETITSGSVWPGKVIKIDRHCALIREPWMGKSCRSYGTCSHLKTMMVGLPKCWRRDLMRDEESWSTLFSSPQHSLRMTDDRLCKGDLSEALGGLHYSCNVVRVVTCGRYATRPRRSRLRLNRPLIRLA